jgi:uncharacterized protein (DUF1330 family)
MTAYVISEVQILDERTANEYRTRAAASIERYGGKYIVRGAEAHVVEGATTGRRMVIVEFPSMERLREWYRSPEYAEALKWRTQALERRLMFVEGIDAP